MDYDYILVFLNTHNALHCENILNNFKFNITILPTPSNISNSCGISIGVYRNDFNKINDLILNGKIFVKLIYDVKKDCIIDKF